MAARGARARAAAEAKYSIDRAMAAYRAVIDAARADAA
jgi:hypothetical protein